MRFRHALLHPSARARARSADWRQALDADCPLCARPYYAALLRGAYSLDALARWRLAAEQTLAGECPDHPHQFDLAPALAVPTEPAAFASYR